MSATVTNGHDLNNFVGIHTLIPLNIFILLVSRTTYKYCYSIYFPIDICILLGWYTSPFYFLPLAST